MSIEIGNTVRLVQPIILGPIVDTRYNKDSKQLEHLVQWVDADGNPQERWFNESDLEAA